MKKILGMAFAVIIAISAFAQGTVKKVRVYEGDKVIYERFYNHVDSIVFMDVPDGSLTGSFSVSSTKKVHFAKGNLQATYDGTSWAWNFAENQYDIIGDAAVNNAITGNGIASTYGTVDLFCWSSAATYYGIHNSTDYSTYQGNFKDWGETMGEGWYTLSQEEYTYLFRERDKADELFGLGTVNGVNGTIILPDDWTLPAGLTFNSVKDKGLIWKEDYYYYNSDNNNYSHNTFTADQWSVLEEAGAVFLPASGNRYGTNVNFAGSDGYYWSSTLKDSKKAYFLNFASHALYPAIEFYLYSAKAVRLVRNAE